MAEVDLRVPSTRLPAEPRLPAVISIHRNSLFLITKHQRAFDRATLTQPCSPAFIYHTPALRFEHRKTNRTRVLKTTYRRLRCLHRR